MSVTPFQGVRSKYPMGEKVANGLVERHVSAGGVVYRLVEGKLEIAVCGRLSPKLWALPKGTPDDGETIEQTALREVTEETGLEVVIEHYLGKITYWFVRAPGIRCFKTVHFFLMRATGGSLDEHDPEFDVVHWMPLDEAWDKLSYRNEVNILRKAQTFLSEQIGDPA